MNEYNNTRSTETVLPDATGFDQADGANAVQIADNTGFLYYIYAVARLKSGQSIPTLPAEGILPRVSVLVMEYQNLHAIISPIPMADFDAGSLQAYLQDLPWLQDRVLAHQNVLAALLAAYTLIPLQIFTLYYAQNSILEMVAQRYDELNATLDRLEGATEWGVKLFCDWPVLMQWTENSSDTLRPLRETLARASAGAAYLLRKKMTLATQNAAREIKYAHARTSHQDLSALARSALASPVQSPDVHGQAAEMILNGTYLVDDTRHADFMAALDRMQVCAPQGLHYELTGPWPPYSFARSEHQEGNDPCIS